jgi:hypothetical protein
MDNAHDQVSRAMTAFLSLWFTHESEGVLEVRMAEGRSLAQGWSVACAMLLTNL